MFAMDDVVIVRHFENLDRRLANVEQVLQRHVAPRLENNERILPQLATKADLRAEVERLQRHMDIVGEALHADIQLLAEHLAAVMPRGPGTSS
jgi:hypothetical protein